MNPFRKILVAAAVCAAVGGCANFQGARPADPADAAYAEGRALHVQLRFEPALSAYRRSVEARPAYAAAWTAMGALLSDMGDAQQAEAALRRATAADPASSRALNNLGYHLLTQGRGAEAVEVLDRAAALAPRDATVQANLERARAQAAAAPAKQAVATPATAPTPDAVPATSAPQHTTPEPAPTLRLERVAENVFELANATPPRSNSRAADAPAAATAALVPAQPVVQASPAQLHARVEVSNGNGIAGLARRVAGTLGAEPGRVRLTNHKPFGTETSRIEYAPGAQAAARLLGARLPTPVPLVAAAHPLARADVRLLLGRDFPSGGAAQAVAMLNP